MDTYSLNLNIEDEVKSYGVEDKLNDYIAVQKQVIPILEKENFYGCVKNEPTGMEIDIGKKGIKESLGSGKRFQTLPRIIKMLKIATLRFLPEIIKYANLLVDDAVNIHGNDERYMYLGIDVSINGVLFKITIDIKKTKEKNKFWMHNIRITEKNSQLLSPAQCQDVHETGNSCNHIIAQNNENASENFYKDSESENTIKIPFYDSTKHTWKLVTELGIEEGDATYIASEFVKGGLIYPFHSEPPEKEEYHNHTHDFNSVVEFLLNKPAYFSIDGFEEYYSEQEKELLNCLKVKLRKNFREN